MTAAHQTPNRVDLPAAKPFVSSGVLGMALFIANEAMFFTALISGFLVLRAQNPSWPPADQPRLPVAVTAVNTLILLVSGWTALRALSNSKREEAPHAWDRETAGRWLGVTLVLGLTFLGVQGFEWMRLIRFGLTTTSSLYGATFYVLVGAHAAHVLGAVIALFWIRRGLLRSSVVPRNAESIKPMVMYWSFVVVVWPALYGLVYFG